MRKKNNTTPTKAIKVTTPLAFTHFGNHQAANVILLFGNRGRLSFRNNCQARTNTYKHAETVEDKEDVTNTAHTRSTKLNHDCSANYEVTHCPGNSFCSVAHTNSRMECSVAVHPNLLRPNATLA